MVEASEIIPLSNKQKDAIYESVIDSIALGDWEGYYKEEDKFYFEYTNDPENTDENENIYGYKGSLDTSIDTIDFDFRIRIMRSYDASRN